MTTRSTRYEIYVTRTDGTREMIQCDSRRTHAMNRARFIHKDATSWPTAAQVEVIDVKASILMPRVLLTLTRG